ncbi:MAG: ribbon-helix-helix domain-containing protein [Thermodesulfobacteriota bacterium]
MGNKKQEIITFKVDGALADALRQVPNRSEFIRAAILDALENGCPLCQGTGLLTPAQKKHWGEFLANHSLTTCKECKAVHLVCPAQEETCQH